MAPRTGSFRTWASLLTAVITLAVLGGSLRPALSQNIVPGMPQGGATTVLNFQGRPVTCSGPTGQPIVFVFNYFLNDAGHAFPNGTIQLNPNVMMQLFNLDPRVALFAIAHECGHEHIPTSIESQADCFAAQLGVQQGWFGASDIPAMQAIFGNSPGDWTHAPGPERIANIIACMQAASGGSSGP